MQPGALVPVSQPLFYLDIFSSVDVTWSSSSCILAPCISGYILQCRCNPELQFLNSSSFFIWIDSLEQMQPGALVLVSQFLVCLDIFSSVDATWSSSSSILALCIPGYILQSRCNLELQLFYPSFLYTWIYSQVQMQPVALVLVSQLLVYLDIFSSVDATWSSSSRILAPCIPAYILKCRCNLELQFLYPSSMQCIPGCILQCICNLELQLLYLSSMQFIPGYILKCRCNLQLQFLYPSSLYTWIYSLVQLQPGALVLVSCLTPDLQSPENSGEIDPSSLHASLAHGTSMNTKEGLGEIFVLKNDKFARNKIFKPRNVLNLLIIQK